MPKELFDTRELAKLDIFRGMTRENIDNIIACMSPIKKRYFAGESIMTYSREPSRIGVILRGEAMLSCIDAEGEISVLERIDEGETFGEIFVCQNENIAHIVSAESDCEVLYIDYSHIIDRCARACAFHSRLVHNLFLIAAEKTRSYSQRVNILSRRSTREKLLAYIEGERKEGTFELTLPLSLSALADYLCVERAAMMREIGKMKREGIISPRSSGRKIYFDRSLIFL